MASRRRPRPDQPGGIAGFLSFLLLVIATLLVVIAAGLSTVSAVVLAPSAWLDVLETSGAYERAPVVVAGQLAASVGSDTARVPGAIGPLDPADVEALVRAAAPPDWLREQARAVIPPIVQDLVASGEIRGAIPLGPLKLRLAGAPLRGAVIERIGTWPECTTAQLQVLAGGTLVRCRLPAGFEDALALAAGALFTVIAADLPDEIELADVVPGATGTGRSTGARTDGLAAALRSVAAAPAIVSTLTVAIWPSLARHCWRSAGCCSGAEHVGQQAPVRAGASAPVPRLLESLFSAPARGGSSSRCSGPRPRAFRR